MLQGVIPDTGLRGYRMRSAICLPVCELALSLSFPEVQPRAPAVYNTMRNTSVVFCGERWKRRETNHAVQSIQLLKTWHAWRTSSGEIIFLRGRLKNFWINSFRGLMRILGCERLIEMHLTHFRTILRKFTKIPNFTLILYREC